MYKLVIERFEKNEHGTFSKAYLYKNDELICDKFKTLAPIGEPTYQSNLNKPIPKDIYNARWRYSPKFSKSLKGIKLPILSNEFLNENRFILIHQGNYKHNTKGCILLGLNPIVADDIFLGISSSINAINYLHQLTDENDFVVEVVDAN